jgi:hypothetical protein
MINLRRVSIVVGDCPGAQKAWSCFWHLSTIKERFSKNTYIYLGIAEHCHRNTNGIVSYGHLQRVETKGNF